MDVLHYKGYIGIVTLDLQAKILHGEVVNITDVITFQASYVEDLEPAFHASVDDYLAFCKQLTEAPQEPMPLNHDQQVQELTDRITFLEHVIQRQQKELSRYKPKYTCPNAPGPCNCTGACMGMVRDSTIWTYKD